MEKKMTISNMFCFTAIIVTIILGILIEDLMLRRIVVVCGCLVVVWLNQRTFVYLRRMKVQTASQSKIYEKINYVVVPAPAEQSRIIVYLGDHQTKRLKGRGIGRMLTTALADYASKVSALIWCLRNEGEKLLINVREAESEEELCVQYMAAMGKNRQIQVRFIQNDGQETKNFSVTKAGELEVLVCNDQLETTENTISLWCSSTPEIKENDKSEDLCYDEEEERSSWI